MKLEPYKVVSPFTKVPDATIDGVTFAAGDFVKISGEMGKFVFNAFVFNKQTLVEWIDVIDPDTRSMRSFDKGRVRHATGKRARTSTKAH